MSSTSTEEEETNNSKKNCLLLFNSSLFLAHGSKGKIAYRGLQEVFDCNSATNLVLDSNKKRKAIKFYNRVYVEDYIAREVSQASSWLSSDGMFLKTYVQDKIQKYDALKKAKPQHKLQKMGWRFLYGLLKMKVKTTS